ncbi:MAG: LacI family DNA-binding transcriptional regulator [Spirochaetes bacterium]|jgi:DNA-binding LacI/PurR family transcriptional regulator|nr:LacI family DNA-binding transcriptional regulator [Spirochaetota bacterium]
MTRLKDIADKMGISVMTVSRALNTPELVKPELLARIKKVAQDLNYVPHHGARSLATNKTGIIQIFTGLDFTDHYFMLLQAGIIECLSKNGYALMVSTGSKVTFRCDGIIAMSLAAGESEHYFDNINVPSVLFGQTEAPVDYVDTDNQGGIRLAVEHLLDLGHREIAFMGLSTPEPFGRWRYEAFIETMEVHGIAVNPENVLWTPNNRKDILKECPKIFENINYTAIVCSNDEQAHAFIEIAREYGVKIPDDLSVVGFDGIQLHELTTPRLTTIVQPVIKIGHKLAELLLKRIKDPNRNLERILFENTLEPSMSSRAIE